MLVTTLNLLRIFVIFVLTTLHVCGNSQQSNNHEKDILLQLKQSWSNPPLLKQWPSAKSSDHCTWPEIACTENSVTGLNISSTDVTGEIPHFICDLKNLTFLDFSYNYIPGTFPTGLYNFQSSVSRPLWELLSRSDSPRPRQIVSSLFPQSRG